MPINKKGKLHALPEQSAEELSELNHKIKVHRIKIIILAAVIIGAIIALIIMAYIYFEGKTYTSYETIEKTDWKDTEAAEFESFQGKVLKYTRDGAVYSDLAGNVIWNQTYEMSQPCITTCEKYLAIYEQGGSCIYILNTAGLQGTINTTIPIQRVSVANQGTVAVLMQDAGTSYLHMYSKAGKQLASGELHIENSGYPLDIALSADAQKLAVSMLNVSEGRVATNIVFYNYGTVGQNEIDNIVGSYAYPDMLVPSIRFVSNDRLIAFGDSKVIIYEGTQKPAVRQEIECAGEIRSIFCDEAYFGLVYDREGSASGYRIYVYDMQGSVVLELDFNIDYTDIEILENQLLCIRNDKKCVLYTLKGNKRFEYTFQRNIYDIVAGSGQRDYLFILNGEIQRVRLTDE